MSLLIIPIKKTKTNKSFIKQTKKTSKKEKGFLVNNNVEARKDRRGLDCFGGREQKAQRGKREIEKGDSGEGQTTRTGAKLCKQAQ